jgi:hypothetical protein
VKAWRDRCSPRAPWTGDSDLEARQGYATWHAPFDLATLQAIGLRQSGCHAPSLTLPRFGVGVSATRDIQGDDLLAFAAN